MAFIELNWLTYTCAGLLAVVLIVYKIHKSKQT